MPPSLHCRAREAFSTKLMVKPPPLFANGCFFFLSRSGLTSPFLFCRRASPRKVLPRRHRFPLFFPCLTKGFLSFLFSARKLFSALQRGVLGRSGFHKKSYPIFFFFFFEPVAYGFFNKSLPSGKFCFFSSPEPSDASIFSSFFFRSWCGGRVSFFFSETLPFLPLEKRLLPLFLPADAVFKSFPFSFEASPGRCAIFFPP